MCLSKLTYLGIYSSIVEILMKIDTHLFTLTSVQNLVASFTCGGPGRTYFTEPCFTTGLVRLYDQWSPCRVASSTLRRGNHYLFVPFPSPSPSFACLPYRTSFCYGFFLQLILLVVITDRIPSHLWKDIKFLCTEMNGNSWCKVVGFRLEKSHWWASCDNQVRWSDGSLGEGRKIRL